jgi:hypothetical protein
VPNPCCRSKRLGAAAEQLAALRGALREADSREEEEARRVLKELAQVICGLF